MSIMPVGAIAFTPSSIIDPIEEPKPPIKANTIGMIISAVNGCSFLLIIRYMNTTIIIKPSAASIKLIKLIQFFETVVSGVYFLISPSKMEIQMPK